jgi:hypothetical protein
MTSRLQSECQIPSANSITTFNVSMRKNIVLTKMSNRRVAQWQDRCSKLTSASFTSEVVGSIPGQTHSSYDGEGDFRRQRRFLLGGSGFLLHYTTNYPMLSIEQIMSLLTLSSQFNIFLTAVAVAKHAFLSFAMYTSQPSLLDKNDSIAFNKTDIGIYRLLVSYFTSTGASYRVVSPCNPG